MKQILILLQVIITALTLNAQSPQFQWVKKIGGPQNDGGSSGNIVIDAFGNSITIGSFSDTMDLDPGIGTYTLGTNGGSVYILKLDPLGNFMWAKSLGDSAHISVLKTVIDKTGNLFITGQFKDTVDFDPGPSTFSAVAVGNEDAFILKLDPSGNFLWVKCFGSTYYDRGYDLKLDKLGNIYAAGRTDGIADMDPGPSTYTIGAPSTISIYILRLNPAGNFMWAKTITGIGFRDVSALAIDTTASVYTIGRFYATTDFNPGPSSYTLVSNGAGDAFVCKHDSSGNFIWAKNFGGSSDEDSHDITSDKKGNIYIAGDLRSPSVDFDPGPGTFTLGIGTGLVRTFILKLNSSGNFVWAKMIVGTFSNMRAIINDDNGNIYGAGFYSGLTDFDPGSGTHTVSSVMVNDMFMLKLDTAGNFIWAGTANGLADEAAMSLTNDHCGNVHVVGLFKGSVDFDFTPGTYSLTSGTDFDGFILKMKNCTDPSIPVNITPATNQTMCIGNTSTLSATSTGSITWFINSGTLIPVGVGSSHIINPGTAGTYTYFLQGENCCGISAMASIIVTVELCTGLEDLNNEQNSFLVYPNPTKGAIQIELRGKNNTTKIFVSNLLGQQLNSVELVEISENKFRVELSSLPSGLYFLNVVNDGKMKTVKVVKE